MKLLFVSNLYPPLSIGGYEENCFDITELLKAAGHEVAVLTSSFHSDRAPAGEEGVFRQLKVVWNWELPETGPTPWVAHFRVEAEWHNARTMRRLSSEIDPDAVIFWNGAVMGRALLSASQPSCPVLFYLFDTWLAPVLAAQKRRVTGAKRVYRQLLGAVGVPHDPISADAAAFCSASLRSQYDELGVETRTLPVIHPGVSAEFFFPREPHIRLRADGEPARLIYCGRVAPEKGVTTLITALATVRRVAGLEDTRLTVMGPLQYEDYIAELRRLIRSLELDSAIDFLPHRPRRELPSILSEHDALVFPSEWREPFGLSLLEAMAVGLPVVTTTRGGPAEFVRDGENARTFAARDGADLADKLAWVLTHRSEAASLGEVASADVRRHHSLEMQMRAVEGWVQEKIASEPALAPVG